MRFNMRESLAVPSGLEVSLGRRCGCDLVIAGESIWGVRAGYQYEVLGAGVKTCGIRVCLDG